VTAPTQSGITQATETPPSLQCSVASGWEVLTTLIACLHDAVLLVDAAQLRVVAANEAAALLFALPVQSLCGRNVVELSSTPQDLCFWIDASQGLANSTCSHTMIQRCNGETRPVARRVSRLVLEPPIEPADPLQSNAERAVYVVAFHDQTAERRVEEMLETRVAELRATLESTADGILVTDPAGHVNCCNERFAALWGITGELLARRDDQALRDRMLRSVEDPTAYTERLAAIESDATLHASDIFKLKSGKVLERVTRPQSSRGRPIGRVFSFRDITESLEACQRIEQLSHTDALTGLANRRQLRTRFDIALAMAQRENAPFAVLFLDLDRFKHINDSLGHEFGDRVLIEVSQRVQTCLRQVDTLARLGGDEFVMLAHQVDAAGAEITARRVLEAMSGPFVLDGLSFTVTCSIGISLYPSNGSNMDELLRHADKAMYSVKNGGRAGYRFHQPHKDVDLRSRMRIDHAMRQALANGRFRLNYQPQIDMLSGEVVGAEALLRWSRSELSHVLPAELISVAEESGYIVILGEWVVNQAVQQAAQWHARGMSLIIAVNVSALQFQRSNFVESVALALRQSGLPPHLLELELTESILVQDVDEALSRLGALAQLGVRMSIDDFGTGYSSLGYLKRFPIKQLKIDRSFVEGLPDNDSDAGIVKAIINLGRALHLQVIAEGVETEAQRTFLKQAGCNSYQGFLYSAALEAEELEQRMTPKQATVNGLRLIRR